MHDENTRAEWRAYNGRRRVAAKAEGVCTTCLARAVAAGYSQCRKCRRKRANHKRARRSAAAVA